MQTWGCTWGTKRGKKNERRQREEGTESECYKQEGTESRGCRELGGSQPLGGNTEKKGAKESKGRTDMGGHAIRVIYSNLKTLQANLLRGTGVFWAVNIPEVAGRGRGRGEEREWPFQ